MSQIFSPGANTLFRTVLVLTPLSLVGALFGLYRFNYSPWQTQVGVPVDQPVPFSHQHHVAGLGTNLGMRRIGVFKPKIGPRLNSSEGVVSEATGGSNHLLKVFLGLFDRW
jgi:hypothetical protein